MSEQVYLVDSSIYVFRAWHLLPDTIQDREGKPLNAVYGFADFLVQLLEQSRARHVVCAFDKSLGVSARNRIYPEYKSNRPPAPVELKHQFTLCQQLCEHFGLPQFSHSLYEADDIIGTLANSVRREGHRVVIVSADKDLTQFIDDDDEYWDFGRKQKLDRRRIEKRFGVKPEQIPDMLALAGDKVDNIPGIPGVGNATAARLLSRWGDLDTLFEHAAEVADMKFRGAARIAGLLTEYEPTVRLARRLTGLLEVDSLPHSIQALQRQVIDPAALGDFLTTLDFSATRIERLIKAVQQ
ncbi:MAG: flap endonuclease [Gammaproteobacteria bacterium]|nr:flap endonuclease [Gammaproteobacteria bacterium]